MTAPLRSFAAQQAALFSRHQQHMQAYAEQNIPDLDDPQRQPSPVSNTNGSSSSNSSDGFAGQTALRDRSMNVPGLGRQGSGMQHEGWGLQRAPSQAPSWSMSVSSSGQLEDMSIDDISTTVRKLSMTCDSMSGSFEVDKRM